MNSEKVKEIKKALEERIQHKPINCYNGEYVEACGMYCRLHREFVANMGSKNGQTCENCNKFTATDKVKKYADILILINELESENERLKHLREVDNTTMTTLRKSNTELNECMDEMQDRIAELESELEKEQINNLNCDTELQYKEKRIAELETLCDKTYKDLTKEIDRLENENAKWKRKAINYYQMAKSYGVECIIDNEIDQLAKENENENLQ